MFFWAASISCTTDAALSALMRIIFAAMAICTWLICAPTMAVAREAGSMLTYFYAARLKES